MEDAAERELVRAKAFPGNDYDFVAVFECPHDMGAPVGAASHVRKSLACDGSWMIVEPFANDDLKDNLNPIGRIFYSFSTLLCTPVRVRRKLGCAWEQAGEKRVKEIRRSSRDSEAPPKRLSTWSMRRGRNPCSDD